MSSIVWQVEFKYTSAGSWVDVTTLVYTDSLKRRWRKHNRLAPTQNTLEFRMHRDVTVINNLLQNDDVEIRVHRAGVDYFAGLVRHNYKVTAASNLKPMRIECVDYSEWLKDRMAFTAAWSNYKVCDTVSTHTSILHQLLLRNGHGFTANVTTIDRTIPLYVNVDGVDDRTYWDALTDILFQFGYVWDFNMSGYFTIYNLFPTSTTTTKTFDGSNTRGDLVIKRAFEEYDGVKVTWWTQKTVADALVFRDTTGGDSTNDMNVTLDPGDTYPGNDSSRPFYANYEYDDAEIIQVVSPTFSYLPATLTQNTFTSSYKRAEVELENGTGSSVDLTKFEVTGTVTYRDTMNVVKSEDWSSAVKRFEIEAREIYQNSDAQALATGLKRYFEYSDFEYQLHSDTNYTPGSFVDVEEANLGISQRCVIVEQEVASEISDTPLYRYECEAVEEYVAETTSSEGGHNPSRPVGEEIDDGVTDISDILDEIDDGYDNTGGSATNAGTTTPTTPTLLVQGVYKGFRLYWNRQTNLTNFSHYEIQVSDDDSTWYSLSNDGTDWKDSLGADTDVADESFHHMHLPFDGDDDNPQTLTLYYRVRRKVLDGTAGDWSSSASATNDLVQIKDLAADCISANKILAGAVGFQALAADAITFPADGLVAYYSFDDGSAIDTSENGYHATITGATATDGKSRGGLVFDPDAADQVVTPSINATSWSGISVSMWLRKDDSAEQGIAFRFGTSNESGVYFQSATSGMTINSVNNRLGSLQTVSFGDLASGWNHIAWAYDDSDWTVRTYRNGALINSTTLTGGQIVLPNTTAVIGNYLANSTWSWPGAIDEVRIYNRAITGAEAASLYRFPGGVEPGTVDGGWLKDASIVADKIAAENFIFTKAVGAATRTVPQSGDVRSYLGKDPEGDQGTSDPVAISIEEHNGENWENRFTASMRSGGGVADAYVSGFFQAGESVLSKPGRIWRESVVVASSDVDAVAYSGTHVVVGMVNTTGGGYVREFRRSDDLGATWSSGISFPASENVKVLDSNGDGTLIAVTDNYLYRSTNHGASWAAYDPSFTGGWTVKWLAGDVWMAGDSTGKMIYSLDDGANWTAVSSSPFSATVRGFATNGTTVVATSSMNPGTVIATASLSNLQSWTARTDNLPNIATGVEFLNNAFVAYGHDGGIVKSVNGGTTWVDVSFSTSTSLDFSRSATDGHIMLIQGGSSSLYASADTGLTWDGPLAVIGSTIDDSCVAGSRFIVVTGGNSIFYSDYLEAGSGIVEQGEDANGPWIEFSTGAKLAYDASGVLQLTL